MIFIYLNQTKLAFKLHSHLHLLATVCHRVDIGDQIFSRNKTIGFEL